MSFCPVVSSTTLAKDEVVRSEKATERARSNGVHGISRMLWGRCQQLTAQRCKKKKRYNKET